MSLVILGVILLVLVSVSGQTHPSCQYDKDRKFLDCSSRGFHEAPTDEFPVDARGIDLSFNNISELINQTFWNIVALEYLDLSHNAFQVFQPGAFDGLGNLICLNLSDNQFRFSPTVFTAQLFQSLVNLKIIRIQRFPLSKQSPWKGIDAAFAQLKSLTSLFLDLPKEFIFGPGFAELTELVTISTEGVEGLKSSCIILTLHADTFQIFKNISIRELRLIRCKILHLDLDVFNPLTSLDVLDLSYNSYLHINKALLALHSFQGRNMSEINLKMVYGNVPDPVPLSAVYSSYLVFLGNICVKSLDLSLNFIFLIVNTNDTLLRTDCLEHFNISFHSTPFMLSNILYLVGHSQKLKTLDFSHGYSFPISQDYFIPTSEQRVIWELLVPNSLVWLSVSSNGNGQPNNLISKRMNNLRHLEAAYIDLDTYKLPLTSGLEQLTYLDISGAICKHFGSDFFTNVQNLTSLIFTNVPHIGKTLMTSNQLFSCLPHIQVIDLSSNKLTDINSHIFQYNTKLRDVSLSNNKFQRIPTAISELSEIQRLDMRSNFITHLDVDDIKLLDRWIHRKPSFEILLGDNSLQCTCDTVIFIRWILSRKANLDNPNNYTCFLSNGTTIAVSKFAEHLKDFEVKCLSHTYLIIAVVGSLALTVLILVLCAIYRYRVNLRYWLYTKLQPPEDLFEDHEYVYDAFVAYTSDDRDWVVKELFPHIEPNNGPTRLCIHDRDFTFGKPIHMNIVGKMAESRKILLVISHGFLESTYGPLEIEYAGMKCLDQGRDDIILCVLMEEIPVRQMPRVLRNLWHKITFLKWSDDPQQQVIFWRNLKSSVCRDQV